MTARMHESPSLIGRDAELADLGRWLHLLADGPAALVISGEAGIGKSTIWSAATSQGAAQGARVLVSRPVEAELRLGYAALGDLLGVASEPVLERLSDTLRQALAAALSVGSEPESGDPLLVGRATLAVLIELAAEGPVLLAIDDAQWLDAASARALAFAARRLDGHRVGVAISLREGNADPLGLAAALGPRAIEVHLAGLDLEPIGMMLRARVGAELPAHRVRRIHDQSGGNPFFAEQLAGAPDDRLPRSLDDLVGNRLEAIDRLAAPAIERVAVLGPMPVSAFADGAALDIAIEAGVLVEQDRLVRFRHPLLAAGAYTRIPPGRRRELHRLAATNSPDAASRARHLALATADADAGIAQELEEAARAARHRGAPETAAELAGHAARLTPPSDLDARARRVMDQADCLFVAADERAAAGLVDELLSGPVRGTIRVRALVQQALAASDPQTAVTVLEAANREPHGDDRLRTRTLAQLAWQRGAWLGDLEQAIDEAASAIAMAESLDDDSTLVTALTTAGLVMSLAGRAGAVDHFRRAVAIINRDPHAAGDHTPRLAFANERMWRGDFAAALELMADERRIAEFRGDEGLIMRLNIFGADLAMRVGRWDEAASLLERALADARDYWRVMAVVRRATLRGRRGEPDALDDAAELRASPFSAGDPVIGAVANLAVGLLAHADGRVADAADLMAPLFEQSERSGSRAAEFAVFVPETVAVLVAADRLEPARDLTRHLEHRHDQFGEWGEAAVALCRGLVAQADGDAEGAADLLGTAAQEFEAIGAPWELGQVLLAQGAGLRRAGQRREAAATLDRAIELFAELGAQPALHRATDELRRARPRPSSGDAMTPSEQRVAALVVDGRTNREVAAELSTTVATVEAHLTRIYGKLGVRSRTQLAKRLAESDSTPS